MTHENQKRIEAILIIEDFASRSMPPLLWEKWKDCEEHLRRKIGENQSRHDRGSSDPC
ncbi:hypothetical protein LCGC14_3083530 [marine sediment metagenome]|uniref:Uncharacterized protein n=1 Tax=marine sediment metagenome TaxID=412755 RepID=A0A0F8X173_9ZZZZ